MSDPIQTLLGSIAKLRLAGEMSEEDYFLANAAWVEKNIREYIVTPISGPSPHVIAYIDWRLSGRDFDHGQAIKLSEYFISAYRLLDQNASNASLFAWAKNILDKAGLPHPNITKALGYYDKECGFPSRYHDVLEVKRKDAEMPAHFKRRA